MAKRHDDALFINEGACNPHAIANALVRGFSEIREEPTFTGTATLCGDPAIRLMIHQLAFICGLACDFRPSDDGPLDAYSMAINTCKTPAI